MRGLTRRSVIQASVGFAAAGALARPHVAKAEAKTAEVWWIQGFAQEEDIAFKQMVEDYQKATGNKIDYSIIPYAPMRQKIVSAMTSGALPDIFQSTPVELVALYAWEDKLLDVGDIIEPYKKLFTETALLTANCYNGAQKKRAIYGVPYIQATLPNHLWRPLLEKAGHKIDDVPRTWDAFYDYFKNVQKELRAKGDRKIYGMGLTLSSTGNDTNNQFEYFFVANGGQNFVTKDGKLHLDDPQVKEAILKALTYTTTAYKEGYVPPSAINWNDSDNNNAFHSKQVVMDIDGTISTEVAIIKNKQDYDDILTMGTPLGNDGKPFPSVATNTCAMIPKGAKNADAAREFLKYLIKPDNLNAYLKTGLGRNLPPMPSIVKEDKWWHDDPHRSVYTDQGVLGPTMPSFWVYNPAYAQVRNEHVWGVARADIITGGMTPEAAAAKAFKRVDEIFAKYPIA